MNSKIVEIPLNLYLFLFVPFTILGGISIIVWLLLFDAYSKLDSCMELLAR